MAEKEAPAEDVPPEDAAPEDAAPEDASPEDAPPKDAPPEDAPPEDAPLEDVPPEGTPSKEEEEVKEEEVEEEWKEEEVPIDDARIMKEVEQCEAQCMEIHKMLGELKERVTELIGKTERTALEDKELELKQKLITEKMDFLDQKTRRIELLIGQARKPDYDRPYDEDFLPKVIVCGYPDNYIPKFMICDDKKRRVSLNRPACTPFTGPASTCGKVPPCLQPICPLGPCDPPIICPPTPPTKTPCEPPACYPASNEHCMYLPPPSMNMIPQFAERLGESYEMQEKLGMQNADYGNVVKPCPYRASSRFPSNCEKHLDSFKGYDPTCGCLKK